MQIYEAPETPDWIGINHFYINPPPQPSNPRAGLGPRQGRYAAPLAVTRAEGRVILDRRSAQRGSKKWPGRGNGSLAEPRNNAQDRPQAKSCRKTTCKFLQTNVPRLRIL